jgi:uncharacterized protein (TIGR02001 family)
VNQRGIAGHALIHRAARSHEAIEIGERKSGSIQRTMRGLRGKLGGGFVLNLHAGRQLVANHPGASYNDYKIGVTKDIGGFAVSAAYVTTTAKAEAGAFYRSALNRDLGADRIVVSVGKTF